MKKALIVIGVLVAMSSAITLDTYNIERINKVIQYIAYIIAGMFFIRFVSPIFLDIAKLFGLWRKEGSNGKD